VAASVSLGEKRFVAVIEVDGHQFLIGGGATNVALLAKLETKESFGEVLNETMDVPNKQPTAEAPKQILQPTAPQKLKLAMKQGGKRA
jgi:flagellar biogenesis protein FliO